MSKKVLIVVTGLFMVMAVVVMIAAGVVPKASPPSATFASASSIQSKTLVVCTGISAEGAASHIAYANCLGKVRGFVDAHNILVELSHADPQANQNLALWCIGSDVTDKQLIDALFVWSETNEARFEELVGMYSESNATAAVIIASLNAAYPCKRTPV